MTDREGVNLEPKQKAMLAALAVVLLALVYFVFVKGGGAEETATPPSSAPPIAQAESPQDPFEPGEGDAVSRPIETFEVFASRDPFEPIVDQGAAGGGSDNGENDPGSSGDPNGGPGNQNDPGSLGEGEIATGAQANQEEVEGRSVELVDVFRENGEDRAQIQVDSTGYTVGPGDVFAENFQLVSTSGTCATLLYGDDQFTLCEGDEILK